MTVGVGQSNEERGSVRRSRKIALALSITGLAVNSVLFALYLIDEGLNLVLFLNYLFYSAVMAGIALCCHRDWHHKSAISIGVLAIYFHMWGATLYESHIGQGTYLNLPIILFMPFCLVLVSTYRALVIFAVAQSAFVFVYVKYYMARDFGAGMPPIQTDVLAVLFAAVSGIALLELAWVLRSRRRSELQLENLFHETERLAAEDSLTGLKNRRAFMTEVETHWTAGQPFVVLFIDLDRFKPINDVYGHAVGDLLLKTIARRLLDSPQFESCARLGGDEFAAVLQTGSNDYCVHTGLKALHANLTREIVTDQGSIFVGASIGYATAQCDGESVAELLHAADLAMLRVKANGGGVSAFDQNIDGSIPASKTTLSPQQRIA